MAKHPALIIGCRDADGLAHIREPNSGSKGGERLFIAPLIMRRERVHRAFYLSERIVTLNHAAVLMGEAIFEDDLPALHLERDDALLWMSVEEVDLIIAAIVSKRNRMPNVGAFGEPTRSGERLINADLSF